MLAARYRGNKDPNLALKQIAFVKRNYRKRWNQWALVGCKQQLFLQQQIGKKMARPYNSYIENGRQSVKTEYIIIM